MASNDIGRSAVRVRVSGVVQGVGFRPFVYRIAHELGLTGWVLNGDDGVHVVAEGSPDALARLVATMRDAPPLAAHVTGVETHAVPVSGFERFEIRASARGDAPTVRISPDLAACEDCLRELFDPADRRYGYPYITCTNCGPRYSIVLELPYDRQNTTMRDWPLCAPCRREYEDPADRRFHAQPVACHDCGPAYRLHLGAEIVRGGAAFAAAAVLLANGSIVAVKGIGGYHLACDARNAPAVAALRERKYRKERPFAIMARDLATARALVDLDAAAEAILRSIERPIVLAPAREALSGVAPDNRDIGVMLPYTPVHHLLFAAGAPSALVMTSANRSSEPIAFDDAEAVRTLGGIADAFLIGERPIARRIDDSIVRAAPAPAVLRRARGLAPRAVAAFADGPPVLAVGGDLKNALTLVVAGQAFASQHVGDLDHMSVRDAFAATAHDLCAMYGVSLEDAIVAHDAHPGYYSTQFALELPGRHVAVQHHRAHVASVLAEGGNWDDHVLGVAFDGTGYGDDGTIWGGEVFTGSLASGFVRIRHVRAVPLPGGDAAARFPVQAAAGFLYGLADDVAFDEPPFDFPERYKRARQLIERNIRVFQTTSMGRLFDTVAALAGFVREQSFEGQAAMWLEHIARSAGDEKPYPFTDADGELDHRPLLREIIADRLAGRPAAHIARAFHASIASAVAEIAAQSSLPVAASGGVFQNALLCEMLAARLGSRLRLNRIVPPNDGGLSLGQAALAAATRAGG